MTQEGPLAAIFRQNVAENREKGLYSLAKGRYGG
jgi:hypothetical protein